LVAGAGLGQRLLEVDAEEGPGVVGHDSLDDDAVRSEPAGGSTPEPGCGGAALVVEDLEVGQAAVVVDGGVDVGVADAPPSNRLAAPVYPPAAAVGDPPELLH